MPSVFNISGQHVEVTEALDKYTREKLGKIEKVFPNTTRIHVVLSIEKKKKRQRAEAEVHLAGDKNAIFAQSVTDNLYKSIDELEEKLLVQVKKYHDKIKDHHKGE